MNEATQDFIREHRNDDVRQLALQARQEEVDLVFALDQIAGWQTARRKLPSWAAIDDIHYPPHLSMEQCSSEQTARYKARLVQSLTLHQEPVSLHPTTFIDLTGGLGVDFSFLARGFERAVYVEQRAHLCELARHNLPLLGLKAEVVEGDGTDFLHTIDHATLLFLDPARRDSHGGRTYGISDCTPDVLSLRDELLQKADYVLLKLSPMLDWRKAVGDLGEQHVSQVHIVSAGGECKELLVVMQRERGAEPMKLVCANDDSVWIPQHFEAGHSAFWPKTDGVLPQNGMRFGPKREAICPKTQEEGIRMYLYEPNASVMKAGCFEALCEDFGVSQVAANSHLFVADRFMEAFPGRKFLIVAVSSLNKRELKPLLQDLTQANITVRNFPLSVAELRKRLKLKEGGSTYLFATTLASGDKVLIFTRRPCTP